MVCTQRISLESKAALETGHHCTVAVVMEIAMFIRKGNHRNGLRRRMVQAFWRVMVRLTRGIVERIPKSNKPDPTTAQEIQAHGTWTHEAPKGHGPTRIMPADRAYTYEGETREQRTKRYVKWFGHYVLSVYYLSGIAICIWTVAESGHYVDRLKKWVRHSGWLQFNDKGLNPENDATSFGQLLPIFTSGLVLFTFLEMFSSNSCLISYRKPVH